MRLIDLVKSLTNSVSLSRLIITTGPATMSVQLHFVGAARGKTQEIHDGKAYPLGGPRRLSDPLPEATLHTFEPTPDENRTVESADLLGQIESLQASCLVGGLNVERIGGRKIVITTHAATQGERDEWLRGVAK